MKRAGCFVGLLLVQALAAAQTQDSALFVGGHLRLQHHAVRSGDASPFALANHLQPGIATTPPNQQSVEADLQTQWSGFAGVLSLRYLPGDGQASKAWAKVLYLTQDLGAWQFSAGRKVVSWDVAYGFRPNDMVQQERRRALVEETPTGRSLLLADYLGVDTAWTLAWVNPGVSEDRTNAREPALAGRFYQRFGAADGYGFVRYGAHTGTSLGGAIAWVLNDATELHGSVRRSRRMDGWAQVAGAPLLANRSPWQPASLSDVIQWVIGGTWTHESRLSLLFESWRDGQAPNDAQWSDWDQRNRRLSSLAGAGAPVQAVAGNLAWQAKALGLWHNLRRRNLFVRASWPNGPWLPALDVLYTPADRGRLITATVSWQADRLQVQGGLRVFQGPSQALLTQLPDRRQAYLSVTWVL